MPATNTRPTTVSSPRTRVWTIQNSRLRSGRWHATAQQHRRSIPIDYFKPRLVTSTYTVDIRELLVTVPDDRFQLSANTTTLALPIKSELQVSGKHLSSAQRYDSTTRPFRALTSSQAAQTVPRLAAWMCALLCRVCRRFPNTEPDSHRNHQYLSARIVRAWSGLECRTSPPIRAGFVSAMAPISTSIQAVFGTSDGTAFKARRQHGDGQILTTGVGTAAQYFSMETVR